MNSILEAVIKTSETSPNLYCVVDAKGPHSYAEMLSTTRQIALNLRGRGIEEHDCVMAECNQEASFVAINFACNMLGAYFVPIESKAAQTRVSDIEEETEAKLLICISPYTASCEIVSYADILAENSGELEFEMPEPEEISEILYTTGTTGKSKGIALTYANNVALAENIAYGTEMRDGNVEMIPLPLSHSHGIRTCYANFLKGGTVVVVDGVMAVKRIFEMMENYNVTAFDASPTAASILMKMSKGRFGEFDKQLDYIEIGTAALSEEIKTELKAAFPTTRLYNFYGSTESGRSCALNFNSEHDKKNCIGKPSVNAKFIITDDDRKEIDSSESNTGLLACAGAMNMKCYWKQPELTAKAMVNGFLFTNDEAYIDDEGYVYVLGRKDDIINFKGIKIAPEEIEEAACTYKGVLDSACIAQADEVSGQVPKLYIKVEDEAAFDRKDFGAYLRANVDANKQPKYVEIIDEIPRTFNGKLQRKVLREMNNKNLAAGK